MRNSFYLSPVALLIRFLILALVVYLLFFRKRRKPRHRAFNPEGEKPHSKNPYDILGVQKGSSQEDIKKAYRKALSSYHPDKVEHLGEDIQALAKERTKEIMDAYKSLAR